MKILDAGDHPLSNADVLDWISRKRAQHKTEDAADKKLHGKNYKPAPRPKNFLTALTRTERELSSSKYPYTANPTTYAGAKNREEKFKAFALEVEEKMMDSLENGGWEEGRKWEEEEFKKLQEMKCLSEMELLMVFNLAPTCAEMLGAAVEGVEERFTTEEQGVLLEIVQRCLRVDEGKKG